MLLKHLLEQFPHFLDVGPLGVVDVLPLMSRDRSISRSLWNERVNLVEQRLPRSQDQPPFRGLRLPRIQRGRHNHL